MEMAVNDEPQYAQKKGWADRFPVKNYKFNYKFN
jgi:hypothetical protein